MEEDIPRSRYKAPASGPRDNAPPPPPPPVTKNLATALTLSHNLHDAYNQVWNFHWDLFTDPPWNFRTNLACEPIKHPRYKIRRFDVMLIFLN